jgi:hypothetical protein
MPCGDRGAVCAISSEKLNAVGCLGFRCDHPTLGLASMDGTV